MPSPPDRADRPADGAATGARRMRAALLALVIMGAGGFSAELVLLEHYAEWTQWLPLVALGAGLVGALVVAVRPTRGPLRAFRLLMASFVVLGVVGVLLHYRGNVEFERELYPELGGLALVWGALRGATPALAPGAMVQLGLLGLIFTWGHPGLARAGGAAAQPGRGISKSDATTA